MSYDHTTLNPGDPIAWTWAASPEARPMVLRSTVEKITMSYIVAANGTTVAKGRGRLVDPAMPEVTPVMQIGTHDTPHEWRAEL